MPAGFPRPAHHHARDVVGAGSNFATVLSVFDRGFGTYYVPGLCTVPLGVTDDIGPGVMAQLRFPFVSWLRSLRQPARAETGTPSELDPV